MTMLLLFLFCCTHKEKGLLDLEQKVPAEERYRKQSLTAYGGAA